MAADFKSHVLRRDEKGLLGVPFKRMLLGGVCGGLGYLLSGLLLGAGGIPVGIVVGVTAIILTGTRGGLPLWLRLVCRGRGALLLAAARDHRGLAAQVVRWLNGRRTRSIWTGRRCLRRPRPRPDWTCASGSRSPARTSTTGWCSWTRRRPR